MMNLGMRLLTVALACLETTAATARSYPARMRWIVGHPAGGSTDIIARLIGDRAVTRASLR